MARPTCGVLLYLALPLAVLLAGCQGVALGTTPAEPTVARATEGDVRHFVPAPLGSDASRKRGLQRTQAATLLPVAHASVPAAWTTPPMTEAASYAGLPAASQLESVRRLQAPDTRVSQTHAVPARNRRGGLGSRLRASVAYRAPDVIDVGLFYRISDRLTVGAVGQRFEQDRQVDVAGQLIDPNDLSSFIDGFSIREKTTSISFGPFVSYRIWREQGNRPALSIAAFSLEWGEVTDASTSYSMPDLIVRKEEDQASEGDSADRYRSIILSASKRLPLPRSQFLRGVRAYGGAGYGARTGKRYAEAQTGAGSPLVRVVRKDLTLHSFVGWFGAEAQLPSGFALYGEIFTGDECVFGYGVGLRWSSPIGISFTIGLSDCAESISQRALDLVYLPGGVGGQPSVIAGGGGTASGGQGYYPDDEEDEGP